MKKSELQQHAESLVNAYEENNKAWAALNLLYAALDKEPQKRPPMWAQLEIISDCMEKLGENGLKIANFLDCHHGLKGAQHEKN